MLEYSSLESKAILLLRQGDLREAESIYRGLISQGINNPSVYSNLAAICGMTCRLAEATLLLRKVIDLCPNYPVAHNNLGIALKEQGDLESAVDSFKKAIELAPEYTESYNNLGIVLKEKGDVDAAIFSYKKAIDINPTYSEPYCNLAIALQAQDQLNEAIHFYHEALKLDPYKYETRYNLGLAYLDKGDYCASKLFFEQAIASNPSSFEAFNNLGASLLNCGEFDLALQACDKAVKLNPDYPEALNNIGIILQEKSQLKLAIAYFRKAIMIDPSYSVAQINLSMALLLDGSYQMGWDNYESRHCVDQIKASLMVEPDCKRWSGNFNEITGKVILVCEQGLGDTIQFMRYALHLRKYHIDITICAQDKLHGLIRESGIDQDPLTAERAKSIKEGCWIPLLSVPRILKILPTNPIITNRWVRSTDELNAKWRLNLSNEHRPIVAINWQGNPNSEKLNSIGRSLPLEAFASILHSQDFSLLSLQKGFGSEQLDNCTFRHRFVQCQDKVSATVDFLETAAIIENCDLVLTSDTAVAHLSGAMGKTTWLLLRHVPDWRWGLMGETTFWYPSMRLFRQIEPGNWNEVLDIVAVELEKYLENTDIVSRGRNVYNS